MLLQIVVLFALAGAAGWFCLRFWRVVAIGSAYKAKVLATMLFGTRHLVHPDRAEEVSADSYRLMRLIRSRVDVQNRSVTASFLGLRPRTAIFRAGLGATLVDPRSGNNGARGSADGASEAIAPAPPAAVWPVEPLTRALQDVVEAAFGEPDPRRLRRTRAVVVIQDGRLIAENYAPGFTETTLFPGWSMTKSVIGTLIGVLVTEGRLSLEQQALLPQWAAPDPRAAITLEDLLRMRSGLKFSEVYSDLNSDVIEMLFNRPDAAAYAASQPLISPPGATWSYSSGTTNILSAIIRRVVGEADYLEWPRRVLFDRLGMTSAIMEPDASGTFVGSSFMLATARDWARLGQLYLQRGMWDGRRIISGEWTRFSARSAFQSPDGIYGAHWWLRLSPEFGGSSPAAERIPDDAFFAVGHEGQTLTVIPSSRLVVVRLGLSIYIDAWDQAAFLADLLETL